MKEIDWYEERGIADEATFDRFVGQTGGRKISDLFSPSPTWENADYLFDQDKVIAELKILSTEFSTSKDFQFQEKAEELIRKHVRENGMRGPLLGQPYPREFILDYIRLFRPPLARVSKKANRQIRTTKEKMNLNEHLGILVLVNDAFKSLEPELILGLFGSILQASCSSIDALVYITNHYVNIPGNEYANLVWAPLYSDRAPDELGEFVNSLGSKWGDFVESELGPFDQRIKTPENLLKGARAIKK